MRPVDLGDRLAERTLELIDIASESGDEARLATHVAGLLGDAGVPVRDLGDTCVLAGPDDAPVLLAGHLDTVPAQDNRPGRIAGGRVHGLGASDMKGAVAVMLELALAEHPAGAPRVRGARGRGPGRRRSAPGGCAAPAPCRDRPRAAPARRGVRPARRVAGRAPGRRRCTSARRSVAVARRASSPDSEGDATSARRVRSARQVPAGRTMGRAVRYCGIDVSATPGNQQLCTLHERRAARGVELVATFYGPGTVERSRARSGSARPGGRRRRRAVGPRLDLLAPGAPLREQLGVPEGRFERIRVCDALLFRRRLPLYPVPAPARRRGVGALDRRRLRAVRRARAARALPARRDAGATGRVGTGAALRPPLRDLPRRHLLLDARPPPVAQAHAVGAAAADRGAELRGVVDADGGLWHRTLDELDACAAAYAAYALATGGGLWVGGREEGVIVLPVAELLRSLRPAAAARPRPAGLNAGLHWKGVEKTRSGRTSQSRYTPPPQPGRAKQRAFVVGALPEGDLDELKELLRTAGVAVVGELIQRRDQPHPNLYLGPGKVEELKALVKAGRREPGRLRRRAHAAPGAQPGEGARRAGARPHRGDPRHLRRPRPLGRGQAPGRARPARVQHGPHARAVDAPRASRRRPRRRRHRHPRPGRVADRDRPPPRARPHHRAAPPARGRARHPRDPAGRARARAPADGRARRLHERRQVDAAQRAHRRRGRRPRPALPHARPDDAHAAAGRPHLPAHRHRRVHPQAAPSARRRVRRDAGGDQARRPAAARRRRERARGGAARDDARGRGRAGGDRHRRPAARCSCSTRPTRSTTSAAASWRSAIPTPCSSPRSPARASTSSASGSPPSSSGRCATSSCSSRSPRAARCPSCTTSPATSSARTPRTGVRITARLPSVVAERYDRYAVNGNGRPE